MLVRPDGERGRATRIDYLIRSGSTYYSFWGWFTAHRAGVYAYPVGVWLPWYYGLVLAIICAIAWLVVGRLSGPSRLADLFREAGVLAMLYVAWRFVGRLSVIHPEGAFDRAQTVWDVERWMRLPDEAVWQAAILDHEWLVRLANLYYGGAHVPGMGVFLVWMFVARPQQLPFWRNVLAASTIASVLIQLFPVAPPRFIPAFGLIDTPELYGQSVYPRIDLARIEQALVVGDAEILRRLSGQLQAMPSIHVVWAVLVAVAAWELSGWWGRSLGTAHALATVWVVTVTGNHYWLDGIVGSVVLAVVIVVFRRLARRKPAVERRWLPVHSG